MSQKYIKLKNNNRLNTAAYGKYYATAVYDNHFVETDEIADYIQRQASVKKSDIKAVLQELGEALKHFFEMGQKIKLSGIGRNDRQRAVNYGTHKMWSGRWARHVRRLRGQPVPDLHGVAVSQNDNSFLYS